MDFLKKLFSSDPARPEKRYYTFQVRCKRCGEILEGRVDLDNDLSLIGKTLEDLEDLDNDLNPSDERDRYFVRKGLLGGNLCFQQIEVELTFDSERQIQEKTITGGTFVE